MKSQSWLHGDIIFAAFLGRKKALRPERPSHLTAINTGGGEKSTDLLVMTNVFRRAIVGMFTAMLVSLCLSVGQKGNKHCLRACVTYRGEFMRSAYTHMACRAFRLSPEGMFHAIVRA